MNSSILKKTDGFMNKKKLIIGLGTGRCGTVSLCNILNQIPSSFFVHKGFMLPWYGQSDIAIQKIRKFLNDTDKQYVGDIGFYWLPYVEKVLSVFPKTKFICLKRKKKDTVSSYLKKTEGRNHWIEHDGRFWRKDYIWDRCFPKYNVKAKEEALSLYWEEYYSNASELQLSYPQNFKVFDISVLNSPESFFYVLDFLEISRVTIKPVRLNTIQTQTKGQRDFSSQSNNLLEKVKTRWFFEKKFLPWRLEHVIQRRGGLINYFLAPFRRLYFRSRINFKYSNYNIGVIIPIRNVEPFRLYHSLDSIKKQKYDVGKIECLVIDYGSTTKYISEYLTIVNSYGFKYLYINIDHEWSKAHALNIGLRNVFSPIVAISDVDIIFSPTFFQSSIKILKDDPCAVIYSFCLDLPEEENSHFYNLYLKRQGADINRVKDIGIKRWNAQPSYGPLITYKVYFELIGGYDEFYKIWGAEDDDLYVRFLKLGLHEKVLSDHQNFYCHMWHEKWGGLLTERKFQAILQNKAHREKTTVIKRNSNKMGYIVKL